jgi:hypothetical protein
MSRVACSLSRRLAPKSIAGVGLLVLILTPWSYAFSVSSAPSRPIGDPFPLLALLNQFPVLGDFDGDRRLDHAELHVAGQHHCIRVRFSNSGERHLLLQTSSGSGILISQDVNNDANPDLIWLTEEKPTVWISDGVGHFALGGDKATEEFGLRPLFFGDPASVIFGDLSEEQVLLTLDPASFELAPAALETANPPSTIAHCLRIRDRLYLSFLRERGPPHKTSFV